MSEQLTLGELIDLLSRRSPAFEDNKPQTVRFDFGDFVPSKLLSYRGYYEQLALGFREYDDVTVAELLLELQGAVGKTFEGYKGGRYRMGRGTAVWASNWGQATSCAIIGIADCSYMTVLRTEWKE